MLWKSGSKTFIKMLHCFNMALGLRKQVCSLTVLVTHPYCSMHLGVADHNISTPPLPVHLNSLLKSETGIWKAALDRLKGNHRGEAAELSSVGMTTAYWIISSEQQWCYRYCTSLVSLPHLPHSSVTEATAVNSTSLPCILKVRTPGI